MLTTAGKYICRAGLMRVVPECSDENVACGCLIPAPAPLRKQALTKLYTTRICAVVVVVCERLRCFCACIQKSPMIVIAAKKNRRGMMAALMRASCTRTLAPTPQPTQAGTCTRRQTQAL